MSNKLNGVPPPIVDAVTDVAKDYANSPHTTNAGLVLRWVCKLIPPKTALKIFAHIFKNG